MILAVIDPLTIGLIAAAAFGGTSLVNNILKHVMSGKELGLQKRSLELQAQLGESQAKQGRTAERKRDSLFREAMLKGEQRDQEDRMMQLLTLQIGSRQQGIQNQRGALSAAAYGGQR